MQKTTMYEKYNWSLVMQETFSPGGSVRVCEMFMEAIRHLYPNPLSSCPTWAIIMDRLSNLSMDRMDRMQMALSGYKSLLTAGRRHISNQDVWVATPKG